LFIWQKIPARTKTAEQSLTSYVELHICGRILIISASISTVIGLLTSARLYVLDIPFNNLHLINFVYLAKNSYSPNTAKSYIAAIGFKNENE
jgi:hypothetical protein